MKEMLKYSLWCPDMRGLMVQTLNVWPQTLSLYLKILSPNIWQSLALMAPSQGSPKFIMVQVPSLRLQQTCSLMTVVEVSYYRP